MSGRARAVSALLLVALSFFALGTVGGLLQLRFGLAGVILSEALIVFLPAWLWSRAFRSPLGLGATRPTIVAAGALLGVAGFWAMAMIEQSVLDRLFPTPPELRASLERLIGGPSSLALVLLALGVAPALAEETLFRGALMSGLGLDGRRGWWSVLVAALLFGAYHGSAHRLIPAALLGVALGAVRLVGGSLWASMAFHLVNNALVIAMVRGGSEVVPAPGQRGGIAWLVAALASAAAGLALLRRARRRDV